MKKNICILCIITYALNIYSMDQQENILERSFAAPLLMQREQDSAQESHEIVITSTTHTEQVYHINPYAIRFSKLLQSMVGVVDISKPVAFDFSVNHINLIERLLTYIERFERIHQIVPSNQHIMQFFTKYTNNFTTFSFIDVLNLINFFDIPIAFDALIQKLQSLSQPTGQDQEIARNQLLKYIFAIAQQSKNSIFWNTFGSLLYPACLQYPEIKKMLTIIIKQNNIVLHNITSEIQLQAIKAFINKYKKSATPQNNTISTEQIVLGAYMQKNPQLYTHLLKENNLHIKKTYAIAYNNNGQIVATGEGTGCITLWDITTNKSKILVKNSSPIISLEFSPDDHIIASGSNDGIIRLWDTANGSLLRILSGHNNGVFEIVFSPDGNTICSISTNNTINTMKVWNLPDNTSSTIIDHTNSICSATFNPIDKTIVTVGFDKVITIWNPTNFSPKIFAHHTDCFTSAAYNHNGSLLATGTINTEENNITLWDSNNGSNLITIRGHLEPIFSIIFSPTGSTLTTRSWDNTVKIWGFSSLIKALQYPLEQIIHTTTPTSTALSSPEQCILSSSIVRPIAIHPIDAIDLSTCMINKPQRHFVERAEFEEELFVLPDPNTTFRPIHEE